MRSNVVQFIARVPATAGARSLTADMATKALETGPGGSLQGATTEEVQQAAVEANPMRRMLELYCVACTHEWLAPALGGCPKCHAEWYNVGSRGERVSMAQRLK